MKDTDPRQQLIENFISLARAINKDFSKMLKSYDDGSLQEALDEGERILNGLVHLSDNPTTIMGLSIIYPPTEEDLKDILPQKLDDRLPIS